MWRLAFQALKKIGLPNSYLHMPKQVLPGGWNAPDGNRPYPRFMSASGRDRRISREILKDMITRELLENRSAYRYPTDAVVTALESDASNGLTTREAQARLQRYGRKELPSKRPTPA